jgi:serine/threonine protein kinase
VSRIGKGTFGKVHETKWLGEKYAKKVFRAAHFESFKTESEILAGLCHPHVVRIVCWALEQKQEQKPDYSLVMDLMQEDLYQF